MLSKIAFYHKQIEMLKRGKFVSPVTCEVDPSNRCNLNCNFCMFKEYRNDLRVDMGLDMFDSLVSELRMLGVKSITFTGGGEPMMNRLLPRMAKFAVDSGLEVGLVTNGTLLKTLEDPQQYQFIRVSLDAATPETYGKVKRVDGMVFNHVLRNIELLVDSGAFVGISYVVSEYNSHEINEARAMANVLGVEYIQFKPAWHNGSSYEMPDEVHDELDRSIAMNRYKAVNGLPCVVAGLVGIVGADGSVYYCCQHRGKTPFRLGNLRDEGFGIIWRRRLGRKVKTDSCPRCRYMNYVYEYEEELKRNSMAMKHVNFL